MDKYLGNKKSIVQGIEEFMLQKGIKNGTFFDAFTGTTNVAQYFKQRGFKIISNDVNPFCYVLQNTYIATNSFPGFFKLISHLEYDMGFKSNYKVIESMLQYSAKRIINDKIYLMDYEQKTEYQKNIIPLCKVIEYLNNLPCENLTKDELFFYDCYFTKGAHSEFKSSRGTKGNRNYFSEYNAKKLGVILVTLREWFKKENLINLNELNIILTAIIEEVTLVANVNGTFHDFNRKKLYPNAIVDMCLKPPVLNISPNKSGDSFRVFCCDSNQLYALKDFQDAAKNIDVLYIDPPYNFRQYSAYYHLLNLISKFHEIEDLDLYAKKIDFVRGQNPEEIFNSDYCYKSKFEQTLRNFISSINTEHVIISYYDENNHWSHGKDGATFEGRTVILNILSDSDLFSFHDNEPYLISRKNYQSQSGLKKKNIDELLFYGRRK